MWASVDAQAPKLFLGPLCLRIAFPRRRCTLHKLAEFLVEAGGILPERGVTDALVERGLGTRHRSGEILSETNTKDFVLNAVRHERRNRYRLEGLLIRGSRARKGARLTAGILLEALTQPIKLLAIAEVNSVIG